MMKNGTLFISGGMAFLTGLVVGVGAGLLLAPRPGAETRKQLKTLADKTGGHVGRIAEETKLAVGRVIEHGKQVVDEASGHMSHIADEARQTVAEAVEQGKQVVR